jgi:selenocysteine-specific elongation factor
MAGVVDGGRGHGVKASELPILSGLTPNECEMGIRDARAVRLGDLVISEDFLEALRDEILGGVAAFHGDHPEEEGAPPGRLTPGPAYRQASPEVRTRAVESLVEAGSLAWRDGRLALPGHFPRLPPHLEALANRVREAARAGGLEGCERTALVSAMRASGPDVYAVLRFLERAGEVVALSEERWLASPELALARRRLQEAIAPGEAFSPGDVRSVLGVSRKFLIPLLERWDQEGFTQWEGERRVIRAEKPVVRSNDSA